MPSAAAVRSRPSTASLKFVRHRDRSQQRAVRIHLERGAADDPACCRATTVVARWLQTLGRQMLLLEKLHDVGGVVRSARSITISIVHLPVADTGSDAQQGRPVDFRVRQAAAGLFLQPLGVALHGLDVRERMRHGLAIVSRTGSENVASR